jgi:hypothetical protein
MKKKILITLVLLVLATLVYFQIRTWKKFDWHSFREQTEGVNVGLILLGTGIIYFAPCAGASSCAQYTKPRRPAWLLPP